MLFNFSLDAVLLVSGILGFLVSIIPLIGKRYQWSTPILVGVTAGSLAVGSALIANIATAVLNTDFNLAYSRAFTMIGLLALIFVFATRDAPTKKEK